MAYPRATVHRTANDGEWVTDDGYRIVRQTTTYELSKPMTNYAVYLPGGTRPKATVDYMREARETICALRATDNQCGHPRRVWKD